MILECATNQVGYFSECVKEHVWRYIHHNEVELVPGRQYVAYGIVFLDGRPWYLICVDEDPDYPSPYYAGFFKIIDDAIPSGWSFVWRRGSWPEGAFLPAEWGANGFFERLLDNIPEEVRLFKEKKAEIDSFARQGIE
jgi:hypothetical protein